MSDTQTLRKQGAKHELSSVWLHKNLEKDRLIHFSLSRLPREKHPRKGTKPVAFWIQNHLSVGEGSGNPSNPNGSPRTNTPAMRCICLSNFKPHSPWVLGMNRKEMDCLQETRDSSCSILSCFSPAATCPGPCPRCAFDWIQAHTGKLALWKPKHRPSQRPCVVFLGCILGLYLMVYFLCIFGCSDIHRTLADCPQ